MTTTQDATPPTGAVEPERLPVASGRTTGRDLLARCRRYPGTAAAAVLVALAASACGLVAPWTLGLLVDTIDQVRGGPATAGAAPLGAASLGADHTSADGLAPVLPMVAAMAGAAVAAGVLTWIGGVLIARLGERVLADLREDLVDRAVRIPPTTLERIGPGDLLTRTGDDVALVAGAFTGLIPLVVAALFTLALTLVGLGLLDWRLAVAGATALPVYVVALRWYLPRAATRYAQARAAVSDRSQTMLGSLSGLPTVRAYGVHEPHLTAVRSGSQRALDLSNGVFRMFSGWAGWMNRAECLGLSAVLIMGFLLVRADIVTIGATTAAALYFHRLFNPLALLMLTFDDVQEAGVALARLVGVTRMPTAPVPDEPAVPADGSIELLDLTHRYGDGPPVLHGVTLRLAPGERVALVGASGAGKTTVAAIATGLIRPTGGEAIVGGVPLGRVPGDEIARHVALVSQEVHVFAGTVRDNVALAVPATEPVDEERVRAAVAAVGLSGWVSALPDGLDTVIGETAHPVSPAAAQQIALARVLLMDPPIVVLDEATAEAGSAGARELEAAAQAVIRGRTALVVAHRLTQAAAADRIVVLDRGAVVEQGSHDDLRRSGGRYAQLWADWTGRPPQP